MSSPASSIRGLDRERFDVEPEIGAGDDLSVGDRRLSPQPLAVDLQVQLGRVDQPVAAAVDQDHRVVPFGAADVAIAARTQQAGVVDQDHSVEAVRGAVVALEAESTGSGEHAGLVEHESQRQAGFPWQW